MEDSGRKRPDLTERGAAAEAARRERLAAALRENLRKRKVQAQRRRDGEEPGGVDGA